MEQGHGAVLNGGVKITEGVQEVGGRRQEAGDVEWAGL